MIPMEQELQEMCQRIAVAEAPAPLRAAYDALQCHRSYVYEVLTSPMDDFIRENFLQSCDSMEEAILGAITHGVLRGH